MENSNYTVLARRFRPQTFSEVVGQDRIARTLRNAILEGRVAHAYLFTGARGVGKTSMARIFAKALNCPNAVDAVPCNECEICKSIAQGQDVDVSEIDGASNRGIDDIRSLRANVNVKSMRSKYKIYIIDEVHMLTKEAFNALLKTLEEPPPMVKFVFCTTEPNKLPDTILSRCQRFDFGTVSIDSIGERLQQIAGKEGFSVSPEAIELVARRANGSMRDSQSLFDQLLAFGSQSIEEADVHRMLGTAPDSRLLDLGAALVEGNQAAALQRLADSLAGGVQLDALMDQLIYYLRDVMLMACGAYEAPLLGVGENSRGVVREHADRWGVQTASAALQILAEAKIRMGRVAWGRVIAELALVRITLLEDLSRLGDMIKSLQSGAPLPPGGRPMPSASRITAMPTTAATLPASSEDSPPRSLTGLPQQEITPNIRETGGALAVSPTVPESFRTLNTPLPVASRDSEESSEPPSQSVKPQPADAIPLTKENSPRIAAAIIARNNGITGTYLQKAASIAIVEPNVVEIIFPREYDIGRQALSRPEATQLLTDQVRELTGVEARIRIQTAAVSVAPAPGQAHEAMSASPAKPAMSNLRTVEDPTDPFVAGIGSLFGINAWKVQELGRIASESGDSEGTD